MYARITYPKFQFFDDSGSFGVGYLVFTLKAGTVDTLATTYNNRSLAPGTENTNPIALNGRGECDIYTDADIAIGVAPPGGDISSIIWFVDYASEQEEVVIINGDATPGTTENNYVLDVTPTFTTIPPNLTVVMNPDKTNEDTLVIPTGATTPTVFAGTGINDAIFTGSYTGTSAGSVFEVQIDDATSSPNTFKWRKDGGAYTTGVAILGAAAAQPLIEGISITFGQNIDHTLADTWTVEVMTPPTLNFCGLGAKIIYKNEGTVLKVLSGGDLVDGVPATMVYASGVDGFILNNPSLPVLSSLPRVIHRRDFDDDADMVITDAGNELSYIGTGGHTLTLLSCIDAAGYVFDIVTTGNPLTIAVKGGADVIVLPEYPAGATKLDLGSGLRFSVRLVSNGANWHLLDDVQVPHGNLELSDGDTWICPNNVTKVYLTGTAAGGGGASNGTGGLSGEVLIRYPLTVVPGSSYAAVIPTSGGAPGAIGGHNGYDGGNASFGALLTLIGGTGGTTGSTPGPGEKSIFGRGGDVGASAVGGNATGYGAGGGGSDNNFNQGGQGAPARIYLEW